MTTGRPDILARLFDPSALTDGPKTVFHSVQTFDTDGIRYGRYLNSLGCTSKLTECTFLLDLRDDWVAILHNMDKRRRRCIRRALEQDYEVEILPLGEELRRTYAHYVANIDRVGGNRLPSGFFEAIAERIPGRVVSARLRSHAVSTVTDRHRLRSWRRRADPCLTRRRARRRATLPSTTTAHARRRTASQ